MANSIFICPNCGGVLKQKENTYVCENRHSHDLAKSGYLNLLLPNQKHSKNPGDDKLMVNARARFLEKGYYEILSNAFQQEVLNALRQMDCASPTILDAGCGEGYYSARLWQFLQNAGLSPQLFGVDISKVAVDKAAKRLKQAFFAVGSVFHLPVAGACCDLYLNLFAPFCREEILRVLKDDGRLVLVIPSKYHLWELKKAVYRHPYLNEVKDYALSGFSLVHTASVNDRIFLSTHEDIDHLFKMTPYYYKTGREDYERLSALKNLSVQISFEILIYQRVK